MTEILTGVPLTVDVSGIADPVNGLNDPRWTYQWRRADNSAGANEADIEGATAATYTPTLTDDLGKHLQVVVTFTDDDGHTESKTSRSSPSNLWNAAVAEQGMRMDATGDVTITLPRGATVQVGDLLTADASLVMDANGLGTLNYQWRRADDRSGANEETIDGATGTAYTPTAANDVGKHLQVVVSFTDRQGYMETRESLWTVAVMSFAVDATGDVTISLPQGTSESRVGVKLAADTSAIDDPANGLTPPTIFTYQWRRADDDLDTNGEDIEGAIAETYIPVKADQGKHLRVTVTFRDDDGYIEMKESGWTAALLRRPPAASTGDLTIGGVLRVNAPLEADVTDIADPVNGLTTPNWQYQWEIAFDDQGLRAEDIAETLGSYTSQAADEGRILRVTVNFMDDDGYSESKQTVWTGPILPDSPDVEPTGDVTVTGTAQVGVSLEADVLGIDDANGLSSPAWTYQWRRADDVSDTNGVDISGATSATYTPIAEDKDKHLRVSVTYTDDDGYEAVRVSAWTAAVLSLADTPATGEVTLMVSDGGVVRVGFESTADTSAISDSVNGLTSPEWTYQWRRANDGLGANAADIADATASAYTPDQTNDLGRHLQVVVTFVDDDGHEEIKESAWTAAVQERGNVPATGDVTLFGEPRVNVGLIARLSGIADDNGLTAPGWTYQWRRADDHSDANGEDIADATAATYTPVAADLGKHLRVTVSFTDDEDHDETRASAWTATPVLPAFNDANTPAAGELKLETVRTDAEQVQLTADTSAIEDANSLTPLSFAYQWQRSADGSNANAADIRGANSAMYMAEETDEGKYVRLVVYFADDVGYTETKASEWVRLGGQSEAEYFATTSGLASFGRSVAIGLVDSIWNRVDSHRYGRQSSYASIGGRAVDGSAFASGVEARRTAKEVARLFGIEVAQASRESEFWANGGTLAEGDFDNYRSWAGIPGSDDISLRSSFSLALGEDTGSGSMAYWGAGRQGSFDSEMDDDKFGVFSSDGSTSTFSLGFDYRMSEGTLLGLALSRSAGSAEYKFEDSGDGEIDLTLSSVAPWLRWKSSAGLEIWGAFGIGSGSAEAAHSSGMVEMDISSQTIAIGVWNRVASFGSIGVAAKADAFIASISTDGAGNAVDDAGADSQRIRLAAELTPGYSKSASRSTSYSLELGARQDSGEAESGVGIDVAGDFSYKSPGGGLQVSGRGSFLVFHGQEGFSETGLGLGLSYDPGGDGGGIQLSLEPTWNAPRSNAADSMWHADTGSDRRRSSADGASMRARLGYGVDAGRERALATLYGEARSGGKDNRMRVGAELQGRDNALERLSLEIFGERRDHRSVPAEHATMLEVRIGL